MQLGSAGVAPATVTPPTVQNYYNRTIRPPARLGNGNIRLIFPVSIPAMISSAFGWRIHPISGDKRFHTGTDIAAPLGTPVLAAYAGQVALADFFGGYGLTIALDHNKTTQQTLYAHLSEIFVKPGEWVKQGEVIGRVGSTGNSTGPHLHFEFRQLTSEGWVALDAGQQLEYALAQLMKALEQTAQASKPQPQLRQQKRGANISASVQG
jgi:murein DD-endopeptidase MepM/ murein hydrolase activator NlpD